jgi:hypothetical protein
MTAPNNLHSLKYLAAKAVLAAPNPPGPMPATLATFCRNVAYVEQHIGDDIMLCAKLQSEVEAFFKQAAAVPDDADGDTVDAFITAAGALARRLYPAQVRMTEMRDWLAGELNDGQLAQMHGVYSQLVPNLQSAGESLTSVVNAVTGALQH